MAFLPSVYNKIHIPNVTMGDTVLTWVETQKYLGVIISNNYKDDKDIMRQIRSFYARGNIIARKFNKCSPEVKVQLFKTYCSNIYAGHLWHSYSKDVMRRAKSAYNNVFSSLMSIKRGQGCSISHNFVNLGVPDFNMLVRKYINGFINRLNSSANDLVTNVINSAYFIYDSKLNAKWSEVTLQR